MTGRALRITAAAALVVIGGACAHVKGGSAAVPADRAAAVVHLKAVTFDPGAVTIKSGQAVTWVWDDPIIHNVTGDGFGSGNQDSGSYSFTFAQPGTYRYQCTIHAGMVGTVTVQ
jgi:plastocyanin